MKRSRPTGSGIGWWQISARGGQHKVLEGDWNPRRVVLFEFPSMEKAEEFYYRDLYQRLKAIRDECSSGRVVLAEGL